MLNVTLLLFSGGEEEVEALVGVTTASPVGTVGEGEATGEEGEATGEAMGEAATEVEEGTITVALPAMVLVTGGTEGCMLLW